MTESPIPPDLRGMTSDDLTSYLQAAGWASTRIPRSVVWTPRQEEHAGLQVALPGEGLSDPPSALAEAVRVVAYVEGFTVPELVNGIVQGGADTLSVRLVPNSVSGSAPLALAQEAITALRSLIVGSAAALTNDALVLPSRRPAFVEQYAGGAQVSSRPGSFILDTTLPLGVDADSVSPTDGQATLIDLAPQPFGRRVTNRIGRMAANALDMAARVEQGEASIEQFAQPQLGLGNALELDALAHLGNVPDAAYQLRLTQSALAPRDSSSTMLSVTTRQRVRLAEAAEFLRSTQPQEGITVEGYVVRLHRDTAFGAGDVTLHAVLDDSGRQKTCVMSLADEDYAEATRAHLDGLVVLVKGDLETTGTYKRLRNPTQFQVQDPI